MSKSLSDTEQRIYQSGLVRIWNKTRNQIAGLGVLLRGGYVLTCAHVVLAALNKPVNERAPVWERPAHEDKVKVDFYLGGNNQTRNGTILFWRKPDTEATEGHGLDIAVLKLDKKPPLGCEPIPLKLFPNLDGKEYKCLGYPQDLNKLSGDKNDEWSEGECKGWVHELNSIQLVDPNYRGRAISKGFSGSPVWLIEASAVVGIVVSREKDEERRIGFMIPYRRLRPALDTVERQTFFDIFKQSRTKKEKLINALALAYTYVAPDELYLFESDEISVIDAIKHIQLNHRPPSDSSSIQSSTPLVELAACLSLDTNLAKSLKKKIELWGESADPEFKSILEKYSKVRKKRIKTEKSGTVCSHLMIQVNKLSDGYTAKALYIPDGQAYDWEKPHKDSAFALASPDEYMRKNLANNNESKDIELFLRQLIPLCLKELGRRFIHRLPKDLHIELFLSRKDILTPIDTFPEDEDDEFSPPLGHSYCVLLRSSERVNKPRLMLKRNLWEGAWTDLQKLLTSTSDKHIALDNWIVNRVLTYHSNNKETLGIAFSQALEKLERSSEMALSNFQETGMPIALWLRKSFCSEDCHLTLEDLLKTSQLGDLIETIKEKRMCSFDDESGGLNLKLSIVYDNPFLVFPMMNDSESSYSLPRGESA